jgi:inner membrane protein
MSSLKLSLHIWFTVCAAFGLGAVITCVYNGDISLLPWAVAAFFISLVASIPALVVLIFALPFLKKYKGPVQAKWLLFFALLFFVCLPYGLVGAGADGTFSGKMNLDEAFKTCGIITVVLFACNLIAVFVNYQKIVAWMHDNATLTASVFNTAFIQKITTAHIITNVEPSADLPLTSNLFNQKQIPTTMSNEELQDDNAPSFQATVPPNTTYNKILIKAVITGVLILVMLIPTAFIVRLVEEREARQKEVVKEVSSKWAAAQTVSTPYLVIPYNDVVVTDSNKTATLRKQVIILADKLSVTGDLKTEQRSRSIYNVLLYRSGIHIVGSFKVTLPKDINVENLFLGEAKLCIGITDFKGIEEKISIKLGDTTFDMQPGLPTNTIDDAGLSVPVTVTRDVFANPINFSIDLKLKGSEQLHFIPLSANSNVAITSDWHSPSFDGNFLPQEHIVSDSGFTAKWSFNQANLPFPTVIKKADVDAGSIAFGVSLIQAADQYAKTMRSVKYAILFIGLTFALFFILELSQNKSVHPVQYILIGMALVIFYTLLLSIGEYIGFNLAYLIAASATILLVTLYTSSLFSSIKTSLLLTVFLSLLYGFIYVLIQLEDTALLAGSIGLFVLLSVAMYYSRRINWYGNKSVNVLTP